MEVILCSLFKYLPDKEIKIIEKLLLNSAIFIFNKQHALIYQNFQTSIYFKKLSFLKPHVFFHYIFSFYRGKNQWLTFWARILLVFG